MTTPAIAKSADGVTGHIIYAGDGHYYFRVYNYSQNTFIDYILLHSDLCVQIKDPDAFFYSTTAGNFRDVLDHSPPTLGKIDLHTKDDE